MVKALQNSNSQSKNSEDFSSSSSSSGEKERKDGVQMSEGPLGSLSNIKKRSKQPKAKVMEFALSAQPLSSNTIHNGVSSDSKKSVKSMNVAPVKEFLIPPLSLD